MLGDTSFYDFVPSSQPALETSSQTARNRRKTLFTPQIHEDAIANGDLIGGNHRSKKAVERAIGPPKATITRRAQSYSDFHDAVKAVLGREGKGAKNADKGLEDIKDDLEFYDWYAGLESDILEASHNDYKAYLQELKATEAYLESLSSDTSAALALLTNLSGSFKAVDNQTTSFQDQCEGLVAEQNRLESLANNIGENLQYYSFLEPITRKLNAPGAGNFVRGKEFSDMLARLDECLEYMGKHLSQKEAPTYNSRYRLLLTRGLTLIRVNFMAALKDIAADITKRIAEKQLNDTTMSTLLYAKFRVGASELKEVAQEIKKRAILPDGADPGAEAEYQSLMNELYMGYANTRGRLIVPLISKKIAEIAMSPSSSKDLVTFAQSSTGYIRGICEDEYKLWREWFEGEDGLGDYLEVVCEPFYDQLRPRIIHETQLLKLCEICTLLQTRYFQDQDEDIEEIQTNQFDFSRLIQPALEDSQTRLVFRTQAILRDDIENFKPKKEDLNYPARNKAVTLSGTKANGPVTSGRKTSVSEALPRDPTAMDENDAMAGKSGHDWYPTLRKAIWLLSRIYRLVNSTVFDDLAHQIVHQTTLSLARGSTALMPLATQMDAQLFLLKHLLILKQQIVAFDIEYVTPDVTFDFSGMTSTFYELRDRGGLFDPRSLWRLLSGGSNLLPRVVENMLDAKVELDGRLRTVINEFCSTCASRVTASISDTAVQKKTFSATAVVPAIQAAAKTEVPLLRRKLDEYLDDRRTKETLVGAVQDQVVLNYEAWYDRLTAEKRASGKGVSRKGKGREDDVWDAGVFAEWAVGTYRASRNFGVQEDENGGLSDRDDDSGSMRST